MSGAIRDPGSSSASGEAAPEHEVARGGADVGPETGGPPPPPAIELSEPEAELVGSELEAVLPTAPPERRGSYEELAAATVAGRVPPELVPLLERVVAVSLESGRARRRYLAEGETVLTGLFRRTPSGRALLASLKEVNEALQVLEGRQVTGVKVGFRTLGHFRVALTADEVTLTLAVRSGGVLVESLAVQGPAGSA